ncbi:MerR family transcriptional regulator [Inconstantimicrobium mannanitabidum]|uniref:MerR family transcriptional regulator n=1 Tax=Inconstantimicrobium mannanitabidum TaxID=1604901 RepID=A0ACB5RAJ6_9CLOT|nr:MerR family transcriptional regulator [Clostridium sp. TW13]GKX65889.1 MerR family transcriptional regulator [Clostridium sp. TW13]
MNISKISQILGISYDTLRYYEKIGLIKNINRDKSGNRDYSEQDLNWIRFLLRLKKIKMPIEKIKIYADLRYIGDTTVKERRIMLEEQKEKLISQIDEIRESIDYLNNKIEVYNNMEGKNNDK